MKDYLNNTERMSLIGALKIADMLENMIEGNLFTKEEKSDIKRSVTYLCKSIVGRVDKDGKPIKDDSTGVLKRLNKEAINSFNKAIPKVKVFVSDRYEIETYRKRRKSELNAAYDENKDYYRLVELIMDKNCKNCTKCGSKCEFYKEFENHCVPQMDIMENDLACKYSYTLEVNKNGTN